MSVEFQNLSVLIVDDEPFILKVLERILKQFQIDNVEAFESATDILDAVSNQGADIIFCDINMPGMDGLELMRHLVSLPYPPAIIVFSGENSAVLHTAEQLGVALGLRVLGALSKPFELEEVEALLLKYIEAPGQNVGKPRLLTAEEIDEGLKRGAILPVFQPQINRADLATKSVETLLRWQQPDGSVIGPSRVIPAAEQTGQIDDITKVIFETALKEKMRWQEEGIHLSLAVNISVESLKELAFGDFITELTDKYNIDPKDITIEVTESGLIQEVAVALEMLTRLRLKGFGLSIDDFSTGAASIQQLRRLPFSELKIDREFVDRSPVDSVKQQMLHSMVDMGRALELNIVAEGVETREEWDLISSLGVDNIQGFYIAKPMVSDDLIEWMKENQKKGLS